MRSPILTLTFVLWFQGTAGQAVGSDSQTRIEAPQYNGSALHARGFWPLNKAKPASRQNEDDGQPSSSGDQGIYHTPITVDQAIRKRVPDARFFPQRVSNVHDEYCWIGQITEADFDYLLSQPLGLYRGHRNPAALCRQLWPLREPEPPQEYRAQPRQDAPVNAAPPQRNAPSALQILSLPEYMFERNRGGRGSYDWLSNAGAGMTVYVLDRDFGKSQFSEYRREPVSLQVNADTDTAVRRELKYSPDSTNSHGNDMAALIAEKVQGVAKEAQIVAVDITAFREGRRDEEDRSILRALAIIIKDVTQERLHGRAVLYLGIHWQSTRFKKEFIHQFSVANKLGIILVTGAGDQGPVVSMNTRPHNLYTPDTSPLIIVGALDRSLKRAISSQGVVENDVWAPGWLEDDNEKLLQTSTSLAAARIAGLAAYFLSTVDFSLSFSSGAFKEYSLQERGQLVKDYIRQKARSTFPGPLIAGNGMAKEHDAT